MSTTLQLRIGPHNFNLKVEEKDKSAWLSAAKKVEAMRDKLKKSGKAVDGERIALMISLELAKGGFITSLETDSSEIEFILDEVLADLKASQ